MPAARVERQHIRSRRDLFIVSEGRTACEMPPLPCAQRKLAAIIPDICRPMYTNSVANQQNSAAKQLLAPLKILTYTSGLWLVHLRKIAFTQLKVEISIQVLDSRSYLHGEGWHNSKHTQLVLVGQIARSKFRPVVRQKRAVDADGNWRV